MFGFRRKNRAINPERDRRAFLHIVLVESRNALVDCSNSFVNRSYLLTRFLSYSVKFIHLVSDFLLVLFNRTDTRFRRDRGPHIRFVESDLVGDDLSLSIATAFNLNDQTSENVRNRILLAAFEKSALGLDAGVVGDQDLVIRARPVADSKGVSVAINDHALEFHFGAAGD